MADTEQKLRLSSLDRLDGRTIAARETREFASALTSDLGGDPSAAQRALIEQASCMRALCGDYGRRWLAGELPANEVPLWLAGNNNLRRLLETVGLERKARDVSLDSYLRAHHEPSNDDGEAS